MRAKAAGRGSRRTASAGSRCRATRWACRGAGAPGRRGCRRAATRRSRSIRGCMLFDAAAQRTSSAAPKSQPRAVLKPIAVDGKTVGYLGYVPRPEVIESIERVYLRAPALRVRRGRGRDAGRRARARRRARVLAHAPHQRARPRHARAHPGRLRRAPRRARARRARAARARLQRARRGARRRARTRASSGSPTSRTSCARRCRCCAARSNRSRTACARSTRRRSRRSRARPRVSRGWSRICTRSRMSDLGALSYHKEPVDLAEVIADVRRCAAARDRGARSRSSSTQLDERRDGARGRDAARAGLREPASEQPALYRRARGGSRSRCAGEGEPRRRRMGRQRARACRPTSSPRLTERLYRVEGSRSRASGGSGLGLAIAKSDRRRARRHAHRAREPPRRPHDRDRAARCTPEGTAMADRILVVEDEEKLAGLLRDYLAQEGFEVAVLHRGDEVEDWVRAHPHRSRAARSHAAGQERAGGVQGAARERRERSRSSW